MFGDLKKVLSKLKDEKSSKSKIETTRISEQETAEIEEMIGNYPEGFANFIKSNEKKCFRMARFSEKSGETILVIFSRISNLRDRKVRMTFYIRKGEKRFGSKITTAGENNPSPEDLTKTIPSGLFPEETLGHIKRLVSEPPLKHACSIR